MRYFKTGQGNLIISNGYHFYLYLKKENKWMARCKISINDYPLNPMEYIEEVYHTIEITKKYAKLHFLLDNAPEL